MTISYDDLHDVETRTTDHATGGQKGAKDTMVGALDPIALMYLARVAGMGARKYAAFNYLRGYDYSLSYNALQRHANLFWAGEKLDLESGLPHIAHAAWHALALLSFELRGLGNDDRPPTLAPLETLALDLNDFASRMKAIPLEPRRFLCGHAVGEEPVPPGFQDSCGTAVHWSRVNGVEEFKLAPERDCNCKPDWGKHSSDCFLYSE